MTFDHILGSWLITSVFLFVCFCKKPEGDSFDKWFAAQIGVVLFPLWIILFPILVFIQRKKLRWLRKYWLIIGIDVAIKETFNRAKVRKGKYGKKDS